MPLILPSPVTVETSTKTASIQWITQVLIRTPSPLGGGSASAELLPMTDTGEILHRDAQGESLMEVVHCNDLLGYAAGGNCPNLAAAIDIIIAAIPEIKAENARLAALAEEERAAQEE